MREILFRGKRIDKNNPANNGKWFEGVYFPKDDITPAIIYGGTRHNHGVFVDPETVGQYTGLTDKNGKRIFEGDILHVSSDLKAIVTWFAEESRYLLEFYVDGNKYESGLYEMTVKGYKVIGNIHDNPELLKR